MPVYDEIMVGPELSCEFQTFEEFCSENAGQELVYLDLVIRNPLEMDPVTLAFSMRHLMRFSRGLMDMILESIHNEHEPDLRRILGLKGIQLDKNRASSLRDVIFAFRDAEDEEIRLKLVRALQLLTLTRERQKVVLNLNESYSPPQEGWTAEDFGGDESLYETVRAVEDPYWIEESEEN